MDLIIWFDISAPNAAIAGTIWEHQNITLPVHVVIVR